MSRKPVERAARGAALKPLSPAQIKDLVLLARQAYGRSGSTVDFDSWRHQQVLMAVERFGLTDARNEDYLPLRAHFLDLLGRQVEAVACRAQAAVEPRSWVMGKLRAECNAAADVLPDAFGYAAGFVLKHRKVLIEDADDKVLWQAVFLVRRRAAQIRRQKEPAQ